MKVTELRVGNWYMSVKFKAPVKCDLSDFYDLCAQADGALDYPPIDRMFEPIPLTHEWLIKFGFKKTGMSYVTDIFVVLKWTDGNLMSPYQDRHGYRNQIQFVHQLQNLYFALTGEELKIAEEHE